MGLLELGAGSVSNSPRLSLGRLAQPCIATHVPCFMDTHGSIHMETGEEWMWGGATEGEWSIEVLGRVEEGETVASTMSDL